MNKAIVGLECYAHFNVHVLQNAKSKVTSKPHHILHFPSYTLHLIHCILQIAFDTLHKSLKLWLKKSLKILSKKSLNHRSKNLFNPLFQKSLKSKFRNHSNLNKKKLHIFQIASIAKCTCCKVHMLQSERLAKCKCCKVHVLQSVHVAKCKKSVEICSNL